MLKLVIDIKKGTPILYPRDLANLYVDKLEEFKASLQAELETLTDKKQINEVNAALKDVNDALDCFAFVDRQF